MRNPFPQLTLSCWNKNGGELRGAGTFSAWQKLQQSAPSNRVGDEKDGKFSLTVYTDPSSHDTPSNEQMVAFEQLLQHDDEIAGGILDSLFREYSWIRSELADECSPADVQRFAPAISDKLDLLPLVSLISISVCREHADGVAYMGMAFGCTWDEEHGLGVLLHKSKVVEIGDWDTDCQS